MTVEKPNLLDTSIKFLPIRAVLHTVDKNMIDITSLLTRKSSKDSRQILADIVSLSDYRLNLNKRAQEAQTNRWPRAKSEAEYRQQMAEWTSILDRWYMHLDQKTQRDIASISALFKIPMNEVNGQKTPQWELIKDILSTNGSLDIEKFITFIRENGQHLKGKVRALREISKIYGEDVSRELFDARTPIESRQQVTKHRIEVVNKALKDGKITPEKAKKFKKYINEQNLNHDHIINGIQFDSQFTAEQRQKIINSLKLLPPELVQQLGEIHFSHSERGRAYYGAANKFRKSMMLIGHFDTINETIFHEVAGHGLRDIAKTAGQKKGQELDQLWSRVKTEYPDIINKDSYAVSKKGEMYFEIEAYVEEFWANRMKEYWLKKNNLETPSSPFTPEEQQFIDGVCEKSMSIAFESYKKITEHHSFISNIFSPMVA